MFAILLVSCNSNPPICENNVPPATPNDSNAPISAVEATKGKRTLQTGDLIFHTSRSSQSKAIQEVTNSRYSHMGIIYEEAGKFYVYEAIQPVQLTRIDDWIKRGQRAEYVVKRLKNADEFLTVEGIALLKRIGDKYRGKDYDLRFEWSDDKIYCSELVWKMYKEAFDIEIGELEKIGDFDLSADVVQEKVEERYGSSVPENELVISPDRMFKSAKLELLVRN